ncbi:hypothetical protein LD125_00227 [Mesoplasma sp. JKS002658]|uniref:alpha/beta hydrolase family protein n=1 Tax=Mesoplasma whartonense TaxID=2878854 RepID=UPI002022A522|nr:MULTISPECIES: alpha/beta fold hydrolase [unclassified Mesoplasma]MCL8211262.1 hypothetical protein [Mesoplasma sp. JKS002664]MCL8211923.1 hypothetical protein [Mesoplasma sp. JKS002662]MCL8213093.1 hypothetical protein [Mesoplasma sp. JKS002660]MCL8213972.1 hypothetical protein [Mesoplasma sp. JKS002658]MCL8214600.1 hypothetical protein [Mesoplasma sp. JKS002663]
MKKPPSDQEKSNTFAKMMINIWNNHFSAPLFQTEEEIYRLDFIKLFGFSPVTRNSNKKVGIDEENPSLNVTFPSLDQNKIAASVWLNDIPSDKWIIGIHGYNSNRFDVLYLTWHYRVLGYNILTFDFRNHGQSGVDVVTWGYKEKWDLIAAINWLKKSYKIDHIGLVGTSMGGFTLNYLMLTEPSLIKEANIIWGVSDSAYMSVPKLLKRMISNNSPGFFEGYANETIDTMIKIYKNDYHVNLSELDFTGLLEEKGQKFPILYVHNRWDKVTDYLDSFRMHNEKNNMERSTTNQLKVYDGYHHTKSLIEFKEDYLKTSIDFVKKVVNNNQKPKV